ncbi:MAG: hypothetical protein ABIO46_07370 [Chitinophagales bacterium]
MAIRESSGIIMKDDHSFFTINDSGGGSIVYEIDERGNLLKSFLVGNAINHDWEELARDDSLHLYIGDNGNNLNKRRNLAILKTSLPTNTHFDSIMSSMISFRYPDQQQFPPSPANWNFDCEAFFHLGDSLYLFSKNNSNPSSGFTKLYRLPDQQGLYVAQLMDSFQLNEPVTAAAVSNDGKTVVLLTYYSLCIFKDFPGKDFFRGKMYRLGIRGFTQREAICFINDHELMLTDERQWFKGGKIYSVDLNAIGLTNSSANYSTSFFKKMFYNAFNNPRSAYKKIMRQAVAQ